jgi:threonine/homoserine/homoserine lactone efflux protein
MNTWIWIAIVVFAWTRPIYLCWTHTETVNGRIVKQHDYVKYIAYVAATILLVVGLTHG